MEPYLFTVLYGWVIGVLISAPMGPIGMLVIHRTLVKGRRVGLLTGLGAALSDFVYSLLTVLGLAFVTDFIDANRVLLQMVGSAVLVVYAVYLFRSDPAKSLRGPQNEPGPSTDWRDFGTGFGLTFSNPLILFFIIGLFARFGFLSGASSFWQYVLGMVALVAGAVCWWLFITYGVNKIRHRFTARSLRRINRVIAIVLCVMGMYGAGSSVADMMMP